MNKITKIEEEFSRKFPKLYATLEGTSFVLLICTIFSAYIVWGPSYY